MAKQSGSSRNTQTTVPEARAALDNMKYEIARELGLNKSTVSRSLARSMERLYRSLRYSL